MKDFIVFNYKQSNKAKVKAEDIPNLAPEQAMNELLKDDQNPYFSVEAIKFPVMGNTHIWGVQGSYEEGYFKSIESNLKNGVIPGSKSGHSYSDKPTNDLFLVGIRIDSNSDGSGTAYFKNYLPPKDYNGHDNYGLIRDAKLGLLEFSLVSEPVYDDKELAKSGKYKIIGAKEYNRNDAVERGAMKQTVNSKENADFGLMRDLISNGQVTLENIDGNLIQNGKVSRPVLRQIVSRADVENKAEYSELISMIDKTKNGGKTVERNEVEGYLKNGIENNSFTVKEIAKNCGFENKLRNEVDDKNAGIVTALNALELGDNPIEKVKAILAENKANAEAIVKNRIIAEYGMPEKDGAKNTAYEYAYSKCVGKNGADLDAAMNALKEDGVMKAIRGTQADIFMQIIEPKNGASNSTKREIRAY